MNLVKTSLLNGGTIKPLLLPSKCLKGPSLTNPSVLNYKGSIIVNLRNVNYTLYHSELNRFEHTWGPLSYVHPENDMHLRTTNFLASLSDDLEVVNYHEVNTSKFDTYRPMWDFVGLEDVRLIEWDGKIYGIGVRRDLDKVGTGRMEISELSFSDDGITEVFRYRIPGPPPDNEYCMKNCTPIEGMPFHLLKWTNPTCIMKFDPSGGQTVAYETGEFIAGFRDMRGGSQVIKYKGGYLTVVHETDLYNSEQGRKDATYRHRFVFWDNNFNKPKFSKKFSFFNFKIEFCAGLSQQGDNFLVTFGAQDNAAYILKTPISVVENLF